MLSDRLRFVTIKRFAEIAGYTEKAVRRKIESGVWLEGSVWVKAPDGRILIDVEAFERWAEGGLQDAGQIEHARARSQSR